MNVVDEDVLVNVPLAILADALLKNSEWKEVDPFTESVTPFSVVELPVPSDLKSAPELLLINPSEYMTALPCWEILGNALTELKPEEL